MTAENLEKILELGPANKWGQEGLAGLKLSGTTVLSPGLYVKKNEK